MTFDMEGLTDLSEKGGVKDGVRQSMNRRLFMQLLVFDGCAGSPALIKALKESGIDSVLYEDINDPCGVALLTMNEEPDFFVTKLRAFLGRKEFASLDLKSEYTMFGRTYALGQIHQ